MIRSHQVLWNRMLALGDVVLTILALVVAWIGRFDLGLFPASDHMHLTAILLILVAACAYLGNYLMGLYASRRRETLMDELLRIIRSHILLAVILMGLLFVMKFTNFPRSALFIYLCISLVFTSVYRLVCRWMLRHLRAAGLNQKHIVLLGPATSTERVRSAILGYPWMGYCIERTLTWQNKQAAVDSKIMLHVELDRILTNNLVDEVIIVAPNEDTVSLAMLISVCELNGVQASVVPDYFDLLPARPQVHDFGGVPAISIRGVPLEDPYNAFLKRSFDIIFSVLALVLLSPVMLVIAITIKATSPGSVIFRQVRIGKGKRPFTIYKFRTMHTEDFLRRRDLGYQRAQHDPSQGRPGWTVENDPRRTRFGAFLRKTSLDEVLQFWNVFTGDMSVIGPRPEQPQFVDDFKATIPKYMVKHHVKPGITGWAQVNGWRGDTSINERINCDLYYIENWSFVMDLKIVWLTLFRGLVNRNAY